MSASITAHWHQHHGVVYRVMRPTGSAFGELAALAVNEHGPHDFVDFRDALRVLTAYEEGPGESVRRATWHKAMPHPGWEVNETYRSPTIDPDREDFHADG